MAQPEDATVLQLAPAIVNHDDRQRHPLDLRSVPGFVQGMGSAGTARPLTWIWQGYIAAGSLTLLTSQWKSGKTTLVAVLLAKMTKGGQLAGLTVNPGKALVISEESPLNWGERARRLHFGDNINFLCRPFTRRPSREEWMGMVDALLHVRSTEGLELVVIDPLANFLPGCENVADSLMAFLLMLQRLTSLGVAVLIVHHPRKGEVRSGQASRGSGVLGGYADILLEMRWYGHPTDDDKRRVIEGYSRHDETPKRLVIELTPDRTDYVSHGDLREDEFTLYSETIRQILATVGDSLTRAEIRSCWPRDRTRPNEATVWRWLERLVGEGLVVREGRGRRGDPFRFRLREEGEQR